MEILGAGGEAGEELKSPILGGFGSFGEEEMRGLNLDSYSLASL